MVSTLKVHHKIIIKNFIIIIIIFLSSSFCFCASEFVRVLIISDTERLSLRIKGNCDFVDFLSGKSLLTKKDINTVISISKGLISLQGLNLMTDKLLIQPRHNLFELNGRRYRGKLLIVKKDNLKLMAINFVLLEDYLKGVLHNEVSKRWPMEALKAQAVASRTYALYAMQKSKTGDYDLTKDIYAQVYGGQLSERFRTNQAVDSTRGQILTYKGNLFPTYFHSTCAGFTEEASQLWKIDLVPLKGVRCTFCKGSPHFRWQSILELKDISQKLRPFIGKDSFIKDIVILKRNRTRRVVQLKIVTDDDKEVIISAKDFRNTIGPNIIRSTNFNLKIINAKVLFEGFGWGHGVGMCQWGAYFMAKNGFLYKDILKFYFPGSETDIFK